MANFAGNWNPSIKYRNWYILQKSINQHETFDLVLQIYFDLNFLFGSRSTLNVSKRIEVFLTLIAKIKNDKKICVFMQGGLD